MSDKVTKLIAVIGRKKYECVPAANCSGCAFEKKCYKLGRTDCCPQFNDYSIACDMDFIYKEVKDVRHKANRQ